MDSKCRNSMPTVCVTKGSKKGVGRAQFMKIRKQKLKFIVTQRINWCRGMCKWGGTAALEKLWLGIHFLNTVLFLRIRSVFGFHGSALLGTFAPFFLPDGFAPGTDNGSQDAPSNQEKTAGDAEWLPLPRTPEEYIAHPFAPRGGGGWLFWHILLPIDKAPRRGREHSHSINQFVTKLFRSPPARPNTQIGLG